MKQKVTFSATQIAEILTRHVIQNQSELAVTFGGNTKVTATRWDIHPEASDNTITLVLDGDL